MPESSYSPLMRIIAAVVITTFSMLILEPTAVAAKVLHDEYQQAVAEAARVKAAQLPKTLQTIETKLTELQAVLADETQLAKLNFGQTKKTFKELKLQAIELDTQVQIDFDAIENHILEKNLPAEILQRHQKAVTTYRQHLATMLANLEAIIGAKNKGQLRAKAEKTLKHLKPLRNHGKHPHFDPNNLPFNVPDGKKVRPPIEDANELKKLFPPKHIKVATTTLMPEMFMVAEGPDMGDLAATPDVQITTEIQALAQELEHNPVKIYNWVHDNIQFIPTYGSIQGSQMTLETKTGNAVDTASLLLALLRSSGIHSRYAYGTVRIPIDKVMNWVGGVTAPEAATQILSQGGIPTAGLTQAGEIKWVRMEHVWVEAYVDFFPSRGTKHITGDTWIPLDASFKQYQFTEGMNIQDNVPFDADGFVDHITNTAQINEAEGWVSGIDQDFMEATLQNYQAEMESYVTDTNPEATVGEVLGTQTIIPINRPVLATGLPYQLMARGSTFKELPSSLRRGFKFSLYASEMARILDNPALSLVRSLPDLAGKRLTLSFEPATDSDRQFIESYLPEVAEGQELDPNDLPTSLPGYLIRLKAQLKIDGEIVAESGSFIMGQELSSTTEISRLTGGWHSANNKPIAGEFYAFGINLQGISEQQLQTAGQDGTLAGVLHKAALLYFHSNDISLESLSQNQRAIAYRQPSFGTFSTNLEPLYSFGVPRLVEMSGIIVDMDVVAQSLWAKNNDAELSKSSGRQIGTMASALEHRVPDLLFANNEYFGESVSAAKLLSIASTQGQKIYTINRTNVNAILPILNINIEVKNDIQNSVAVGKEVTISQNQIIIGNWSGVGYIINDPETGAGAYMISGGSNGGGLNFNTNLNGIGFSAILFSLGLGTLVPFYKDLFERLKCADEVIKNIVFIVLMMIIALIIVALTMRFLGPLGAVAGTALARGVVAILMTLTSQVALAAKNKNCCGTNCPKLQLVSILFGANDPKNFLKIWKDEIGGITEIRTNDPQWKYSMKSQPLGYVSGAKLTIKAIFKVLNPPKKPGTATLKTRITIKNKTQNQKATIPYFSQKSSINLSASGNGEKTVTMTASVPLKSNLTQFFNSMTIDWDFSFKNRRYDIEESKHQVYVTLKLPVTMIDKIYLTSLHLATSNPGATGTTIGKAKKQAIHNTWKLFETKSIRNWKNERLYYYKYGKNALETPYCEDWDYTRFLGKFLTLGEGQCDAFAKLFNAALAVNGILATQVEISSKIDQERVLAKNWQYPITPTFSNTGFYQWRLILKYEGKDQNGEDTYGMVPPNQNNRYGDLLSLPGLAGQNSATPSEKTFGVHYITKVVDPNAINDGLTILYYDPSYGVTYAGDKIGAEVNFENQAVDGYFKRFKEDVPKENPGEGHFRIRRSNGIHNIQFSR